MRRPLGRLVGAAVLLALTGCSGAPPCGDAGHCADAGEVVVHLLTSVPSAGAADVEPTTPVQLGFSLPLEPRTLAVAVSPDVALGEPEWNAANDTVTFRPPEGLAVGTRYSVVASGSGPNGALLRRVELLFTTRDEQDGGPPSLLTTTPKAGATNVPLTAPVVLTFSHSMDTTSVAVATTPPLSLGAGVWSSQRRSLAFTGHTLFTPETEYEVTVTGRSERGAPLASPTGFRFTTAPPPDETRPEVLGLLPALDGGPLPVGSSLGVAFSEPMSAGTAQAVRLLEADGGLAPMACPFVLDADKRAVRCTPSPALLGDTHYEVLVSAAPVFDLAGNMLAADVRLPFRTAAGPDVTPPEVVWVLPDAGALGVVPDTSLEVQFSEPMARAQTEAAFTVPSTFSWNDAGTRLLAQPTGPFALDAGVTWGFGSGGRDLAGNALAPVSVAFGVVRRVGVVVPASVARRFVRHDAGESEVGSTPFRVGRAVDAGVVEDERLVLGFAAVDAGVVVRVAGARLALEPVLVVGAPGEVRVRAVRDAGFAPPCVGAPCEVASDAGLPPPMALCAARGECLLHLHAPFAEDAGATTALVTWAAPGTDGGPAVRLELDVP